MCGKAGYWVVLIGVMEEKESSGGRLVTKVIAKRVIIITITIIINILIKGAC